MKLYEILILCASICLSVGMLHPPLADEFELIQYHNRLYSEVEDNIVMTVQSTGNAMQIGSISSIYTEIVQI